MIHYFIQMKSGNKEKDHLWYESVTSFKTDIQINLNETLSLGSMKEDWQKELREDYKTSFFKVVDKIIRIDELNGDFLIDEFVDIYLEPVYSGNIITVILEDYKGKIFMNLKPDDEEAYNYWFDCGRGVDVLSLFPNIKEVQVGDVINLDYSSVYFKQGKYERDFYKDWKTSEILVKEKHWYYNTNITNEDGNDDLEEFCPDQAPVPSIFLHVELMNNR
ncbi:hypothetical protein [Sphingobacterium faecium]|uniref:hypothetical protein n=1 Tax=Sphingobacterium faecium TaxID=34087 RepID=UPI002478CDF8|nr:hypothetical protein [Sphingobacterium faecium]WGQ17068.1 hypothetical protein QG727_22750 [Sphingobacterium faecium]